MARVGDIKVRGLKSRGGLSAVLIEWPFRVQPAGVGRLDTGAAALRESATEPLDVVTFGLNITNLDE
jgi:hypothetical protein